MAWKLPHTKWLEKQIAESEARHEKEIARLEKSHAEQLKYAIEENERLREELTRTRYLLTPALQSVSLEPDNTPPAALSDENVGTPWQRILKRSIKAQQEQDSIAHRVASEAAAKAATEAKEN
jgi:hypothetical protein